MNWVQAQDLEAIAIGSAVYGTGGGGDPYIGMLLAQQTMRQHGPVRLIAVDEVGDDDLVIPVAMAGAPTVLLEKLADIEPLVAALRRLERELGRPATAVMSAEVGGLNSTIPFSVASATGLPLVDADTMGRAFPEIQMTLATLAGVAASPVAMADEKGNTLLISALSNAWTERFVRSALTEMGAASSMALLAMNGAQLRRATVRGSITQAWRCGQAWLDARAANRDAVGEVRRVTGGFHIFTGKVVDVQRALAGGFCRGQAVLAGLDAHDGQQAVLHFQNEFLLAESAGSDLCATPDLIVMLDLDTGEPITAEQARYGLRVAVLGIPCVPAWRTAEALDLVGPQRFGYARPYVPLEQLIQDR